MVNCTVKVYKDVDTLDHGHRTAGADTSTALWDGPAWMAAPSRGWAQEAALEGILAGDIHVHTTVNLAPATRVEIAGHSMAGSYQVLSAAVTSSEWRLTLARRPVNAA